MSKRFLKSFISTVLLLFFFNLKTGYIYAVENPKSSQNNIFGIHIFDENDLGDASVLVNSSGGDWGYITFVIRDDERNTARLQSVFNKMRRYHLIPIVRIASHQENGGWAKLMFEDIENWVSFLNSLNWVVKNRYIVVGNEPNHADEWGGEVNPEEYATYLKSFSSELKSLSEDYFILPAGFDSSAPNDKTHTSEFVFLKRILNKEPGIFGYIDGWASHSYPNPNFSGSVNDTGPKSIKAYIWELDLLNKLNIKKELPVFITETGWSQDNLTIEKIGSNYLKAFEMWFNDKNIVAVTPFILNYQGEPFYKFSWKDKNNDFFTFFSVVQKILKKLGTPVQVNTGEIKTSLVPQFIKKSGKIYGVAIVENTGQVIWERGKNYTILTKKKNNIEIDSPLFFDIEPGHSGIALFREVK